MSYNDSLYVLVAGSERRAELENHRRFADGHNRTLLKGELTQLDLSYILDGELVLFSQFNNYIFRNPTSER